MKIKAFLILLIAVSALSSCDREKRNKRAEEKGRSKTEKQASFIKGVGEGLKGAGKDAVQSVSEGIGEIAKGANEGFDNSFVKMNVEVVETLAPFVTVSRCEVSKLDTVGNKGILVYTVFEQDFDGKLLLKAFDSSEQEIGRSLVTVKEEADKSRFIEFPFDERTSFTLIKKLVLDHRSK